MLQRRILIVSPVKDEERFIERTLRSVTGQTLLPARWIVVDDGSTDATPRLIQQCASQHPWIHVVQRTSQGPRAPGSAVMHAFYEGLSRAGDIDHDYIVKLDCDVELPADYFESLVARFERDASLGIASGQYLEDGPHGWQAIDMPDYHAAGASKVIRAECFRQIGGFVRERGWDTVDEVRAQCKGWATRHFKDIQFRHLKPEGSGIGSLRTNVMHGDVYFLTGGGLLFLMLKVIHRMVFGTPRLMGGAAMLYGYLRCALSGRQRLVTDAEAQHYQKMLNRRLLPARLRFGRSAGARSMESF